jgi:hypothetical protein
MFQDMVTENQIKTIVLKREVADICFDIRKRRVEVYCGIGPVFSFSKLFVKTLLWSEVHDLEIFFCPNPLLVF